MVMSNFLTTLSIGAALTVSIAQWVGKPSYGRAVLSSIAFLYAGLTWYCIKVFTYTLATTPSLFMIYVPILFCLGPLLYIYFCHIGLNRPIKSKSNTRHFGLIAVGICLYMPFLFMPSIEKVQTIETLYQHVQIWPYGLVSALCGILILAYLGMIIAKQRYLFRLDSILKKRIFQGFAIVQIGLVSTLLFSLLSSTTLILALEIGSSLFGILFVFIVAIQLRHPEWLAAWVGEVQSHYAARDYLSGTEVPEAIAKMKDMAALIYADTELSLHKFSEETGLNKYQISQLLNQHLNLKFKQFLAEYRIPAAAEQLRTLEWKTTLAIAMDVGYNSYGTFCSHFKAKMGMSPQAYRKKHMA